MKLNTTLYADGMSYFVIADAQDVLGIVGHYIIHMEGTPTKLYKLWLNHKEEININNLYFMMKDDKFFKNHSEELKGYDGVYKYIGS